ncbi:non-ribosomal peptide synthase/polyketide synthase [Microbacterium sp. HM58-2]|nr:non-ribosomal peptide synthase/polyketide synthase [Microbacterium sp. HM58-2]
MLHCAVKGRVLDGHLCKGPDEPEIECGATGTSIGAVWEMEAIAHIEKVVRHLCMSCPRD